MCVRISACPTVCQRSLCACPLTPPGRSHRIHQCTHYRHTNVQAQQTQKTLQWHILQQEHPHMNLCTHTVFKVGHVLCKSWTCYLSIRWWALTDSTHNHEAVVNMEWFCWSDWLVLFTHTRSYWEMQLCWKNHSDLHRRKNTSQRVSYFDISNNVTATPITLALW